MTRLMADRVLLRDHSEPCDDHDRTRGHYYNDETADHRWCPGGREVTLTEERQQAALDLPMTQDSSVYIQHAGVWERRFVTEWEPV